MVLLFSSISGGYSSVPDFNSKREIKKIELRNSKEEINLKNG